MQTAEPKSKDLYTDGVVELIGNVVTSAAKDYRYALKKGLENRKKECERFFLSEYFHVLTNLDGQAVIDKIRRDMKEEIKNGDSCDKNTQKTDGLPV